MEMHTLAHGRCKHCHNRISISESHLAHIIPKTVLYLSLWGPEVIHHPDNMDITCAGCNHKSLLDPKTHPVEAEEHIRRIQEKIKNGY